MQGLLKLDGLLERLQGYVRMRNAKLVPSPKPGVYVTLKLEAAYMLQEVLLRGQLARGDVIRASGMAERTGRIVLGNCWMRDCWCPTLQRERYAWDCQPILPATCFQTSIRRRYLRSPKLHVYAPLHNPPQNENHASVSVDYFKAFPLWSLQRFSSCLYERSYHK